MISENQATALLSFMAGFILGGLFIAWVIIWGRVNHD